MKKLVATLAVAVLTVGITATSVSAEEYEVKKGDSLWNIANEYNTTVDKLLKINALHNTVIQPKQTLVVSEEENEDPLYVVKEGDTLIGIASEFDVSVKDIKKWNDLSSDLIIVGQELEMNGVRAEQDAPAEVEQVEEAETEEIPEKEEKAEKVEEKTKKKEQKEVVKAEETQSEAPTEKEDEDADKADEASADKQSEANDNDKSESPEGETISVSATAYTATCDGCTGVTATGVDLNADRDAKVIAVDPDVIPLGSKVYVEGYGYATAADTGGAIKGNKIDLHVPSVDEANNWGVQSVNVTIVE